MEKKTFTEDLLTGLWKLRHDDRYRPWLRQHIRYMQSKRGR